MVKIAIAGASGKLAREVIDKLIESGKHEILGLVRKDPSSLPPITGLKWTQTNYQDKSELVEILKGVHTVLSFILDPVSDPDALIQKRLVDASIEAGVKRFAPSEWAMGQKLEEVIEFVPWFNHKLAVRKYLQDINKDSKVDLLSPLSFSHLRHKLTVMQVIEYTIFQAGAFTNYFAHPHQTAKHYRIDFAFFADVGNARGFMVEGSEDAKITLTTVDDVAEVTARAVEYEGEWPSFGGIAGNTITIGELMKLGEEVRGKPFEIDRLKLEDVKNGILKTNFYPRIPLPGLSEEQAADFSKVVARGLLISVGYGALEVSDEWNKLLPDWKPTKAREFLQEVWGAK
ncbi:hypothetical protein CPLU01_10950 [Colletotrichum plurivorum]|uniref:NmrA-like domain-containing protein n=1 Tax=Colletotrichum plurivorum TaxID=2175906 RepID=A0A8H6K4E3_9PEZI|nr:hypothetical protein CPLU01_10950 [Colletotrichum plurivorum]